MRELRRDRTIYQDPASVSGELTVKDKIFCSILYFL